MEVISRDYVTQNLSYHDQKNTFTNQELNDNINFWKIILFEKYHMRPGMSIGLVDQSVSFTYTSLFFAAAELGLKILIFPEKPTREDGYSSKMETLVKSWGFVDLIYYDNVTKNTPSLVNMCRRYSTKTMQEDIFHEYTIDNPATFNNVSTKIFSAPDDVLLWTTSSGTTGEPKLLTYTHQQLYRIGKRNAVVLDLKNQRIAHVRNMHHAAVLMANFLPGFAGADEHYQFVSQFTDDVEEFVNFVIANKISRLMLSWKSMLDNMLDYMIKNEMQFEHSIDIIVGGYYITPDYVEKIQKVRVARLRSMFGGNETCGPILLRTIDATTTTDNYQINYMGNTVDQFFNVNIVDGKLSVGCPALYPQTIQLEDLFAGNSVDGYTHLGRSNFYRINETDFQISELADIVNQNGVSADVVVDVAYQKIYIAVWQGQINLDDVNSKLSEKFSRLQFDKVAYLNKQKYEEFKLDHESLRQDFRKN